MDEDRYRGVEQRLWLSVGATPTDKWLDLRRIGARVRVQEIGEGPVVLFLHGGAVCGACWAPLVARLADFRCVVLDRPGCGLSPPMASGLEDVEQLARFADALVSDVFDALEVERGHVAATSFGGYMGIRSAAAHPNRVEKLLLFGFPVGAPTGKTALAMRIGSVGWIARAMSWIPPNERIAREMLKGIGLREALEAGRVSQEMIDWFVSMMRDTDTVRNETSSLPQIVTLWRGLNQRLVLPATLLGRVEVPTYLLWGDKDPFGGADTARSFVTHFPDAKLEVMPGAGHAVWMDDAQHAADVSRRFLTI